MRQTPETLCVPASAPRLVSHQRAGRGGFALVWLALVLVVLVGFVALGIDMGRIRLAQTELQAAADAGARAACWPIPQLQFAEGIDRAESVVAANDAGGDVIGFDVNDEDLKYGIWWRNTRSFQVLPPQLWNRANAVRIITHRDTERGNPLPMAFASAINWDETDVRAAAVAQIHGGTFGGGSGNIGIFGIEWVELNGTTMTDSYNPLEGPYDPNNAGSEGGVGTNGHIRMVGNCDVNGDARWGPDGDTSPNTDYLSKNSNSTITGWQAPLTEDLVFPPVTIPQSYNNQPLISAGYMNPSTRDVSVNGKATLTIPGGPPENPAVYYIHNIKLRANQTIRLNGAVELYVDGWVDITGNVICNDVNGNSHPLPSNLKIFVIGDGMVDLGGGSALTAQIYAPESDCRFHGTGQSAGLFGGVIGKTVDIKGNSEIHVDETLRWPGQSDEPFRVELVH